MKLGKGYRTQNGIPLRARKKKPQPNGLLLRGVVMATYVTDDSGHPKADDLVNRPSAVYCDVLVYTSLAYSRWFNLSKVLVSQKRGGLHNDDLWKPRSTSKNITTTLNDTNGANPGSFDGDHVLIGFMNDSFDEPVILKGLPHPARDVYNDLYNTGKRIKLKAVDGDPDFVKHHGVFHGVDDSGNYIVNSTFANDGTTNETGKEPEPDVTGTSGNQTFVLPQNSDFTVELKDMTNPLSPTEYLKLAFKKDNGNLVITTSGVNTVEVDGSGPNTTLTLGDGSAKAAIADLLETLWTATKILFDSHVHSTTTPFTPTTTFPAWNSDINSDKLTFPFN